jgi:hypothetical protein
MLCGHSLATCVRQSAGPVPRPVGRTQVDPITGVWPGGRDSRQRDPVRWSADGRCAAAGMAVLCHRMPRCPQCSPRQAIGHHQGQGNPPLFVVLMDARPLVNQGELPAAFHFFPPRPNVSGRVAGWHLAQAAGAGGQALHFCQSDRGGETAAHRHHLPEDKSGDLWQRPLEESFLSA